MERENESERERESGTGTVFCCCGIFFTSMLQDIKKQTKQTSKHGSELSVITFKVGTNNFYQLEDLIRTS